jgi:hypothetical protein
VRILYRREAFTGLLRNRFPLCRATVAMTKTARRARPKVRRTHQAKWAPHGDAGTSSRSCSIAHARQSVSYHSRSINIASRIRGEATEEKKKEFLWAEEAGIAGQLEFLKGDLSR